MASNAMYQAFVEVVPEASNLRKLMAKQFGDAGGEAGRSGGKAASGGILSSIKGVAGPLTAALAGVFGGIAVGSVFKGGFDRLLNIEGAQAKLKGLGHDAATVTQVMENALASVKGTAFGLDSAATTAAGAIAAGIKPGEELTKYLTLTSDAATIAGTSMDEMGSIINKVTTSGKAQADNLNQLADRGIPIFQWLADEYGVTAGELTKMVSSGKVDAATFQKVIADNIGGAAQSAGDTTAGAFANMRASMNRVAANLLSGVFPMFKTAFQGITAALGPVEDGAKMVGEKLGGAFAGAIPMLADFGSKASTFLAPFAAAFAPLGPVFAALVPQLMELWQAFSPLSLIFAAIAPMLPQLVTAFVGLATTIGGALGSALTLLLPSITQFSTLLVGLITGLITTLLPIIVQLVSIMGPILSSVITAILPLVTMLMGVFTQLFAAIMPLLAPILGLIVPLVQLVGAILPPLIALIVAILDPIIAIVSGILGLLIPALTFIITVISQVVTSIAEIITWFVNLVTGSEDAGTKLEAFFTGLPAMILEAIGDLGDTLFSAGEDLIQGLIDGVSGMAGGIGDAIGGVLDFAGGFFPHSPAKRGPFSGSGWTAVKSAGLAIGDQFGAGLTASEPGFNAQLESLVPTSSLTAKVDASVYGSSSGSGAAGSPESLRPIVQNISTIHGQSNAEIAHIAANDLNGTMRGF